LPHELKPRFQKLVFPEGVAYDLKIKFRTTKLGYIYELIQKNEDKKSQFLKDVDFVGFYWDHILEELYQWGKVMAIEKSLNIGLVLA
jgi:hypothetical protein